MRWNRLDARSRYAWERDARLARPIAVRYVHHAARPRHRDGAPCTLVQRSEGAKRQWHMNCVRMRFSLPAHSLVHAPNEIRHATRPALRRAPAPVPVCHARRALYRTRSARDFSRKTRIGMRGTQRTRPHKDCLRKTLRLEAISPAWRMTAFSDVLQVPPPGFSAHS